MLCQYPTRTSRWRCFRRVVMAAFFCAAGAAAIPGMACTGPCDGSVDTAWANNGTATVIANNAGFGKLLPLANGKIVEVATCALGNNSYSVCVTRLQKDGSLDAGFGVGGHAVLRQMAGALHNQSSGLVASAVGGALFVSQDIAFSSADMAPDGHIVIAAKGANHRWVVRLRADGTAIDSVLTDPLAQSELRAVLVQRDGKVVLVGHGHPVSHRYVTVARFLPDLSAPDPSFGFSGVSYLDPSTGVTEAFFHDLAETADGALVFAGEAYVSAGANSHYEGYVVRLTSAGSYDAGFDSDGRWLDAYSSAYLHVVASHHYGEILVAGNGFDSLQDPSDLRVAGLLPDATVLLAHNYSAPACGNGSDSATGLALQTDGNLLLAGVCSTGAEQQLIEMTRIYVAGGASLPFGSGYAVFQPPGIPTADGIAVGAGGLLLDWRSLAAGDTTRRITRFGLDRIFSNGFEP